MEKINPSDFQKGDRVRYIPTHANGDINHPSCETGIVSSIGDKFVFVKYFHVMPDGTIWPPIVTGDEPYTAAATDPNDLILWEGDV